MRRLGGGPGGLDLSGLDAGVLGPDAVARCRDAAAAVAAARDEAKAIRGRAEAARAATLRAAKAAGFDAGLADAAACLTDMRRELDSIRARRREEATELAFALVRKVFGAWPEEVVLTRAVEHALAALDPEEAFVVALHGDDRARLAEALPPDRLRVDPALPPGTARIETAQGEIAVSVERQLALLRAVLEDAR